MEPLRVLVVDDEEEFVSTLVERLELRGIRAIGTTAALEAIDIARREDLGVVLLDVKMPGIGGFELFGELRSIEPDLAVTERTLDWRAAGFAREKSRHGDRIV